MTRTQLGRRLGQLPRAYRNWPYLLTAGAAGNFTGHPGELSFHTRTGPVITCPNVPAARGVVFEVFAEDCYELDWFLGSRRNDRLRVIDIGAHVGAFALRLAALAPNAEIHCYEPSSVTAGYLRKNIAANAATDRITAHQEAVAGVTGTVTFADTGEGSAHNSMSFPVVGAKSRTEVPARSLQDAVALAGGDPDVVKIDCEGAEYDIVEHTSTDLWQSVTHVVLEYHRVESHTWQELYDRFLGFGFTLAKRTELAENLGLAWLRRPGSPA